MKKIGALAVILIFLISGCGRKPPSTDSSVKSVDKTQESVDKSTVDRTETIYSITMKRDILALMLAYPDYINGVEAKEEDNAYIIMKSGKRILYDDKKQKSFEEKMLNADIQDMLEQIYPLNDISKLMDKDNDPGRIRAYSLFNDIYGVSKEKIQSDLVNVKAGGRSLQFNKNNRAADFLKAAFEETNALIKSNPKIYSFVYPSSGTFNYRVISGTNQLSAHAFGIAIDLKSDKRDYWKWASRQDGEKRLNEYPRELVRVFEKNNFIWGGKWNHFDILHFEYRPEIIIKGKYFAGEPDLNKLWHDGINLKDDRVEKYVKIIDSALK